MPVSTPAEALATGGRKIAGIYYKDDFIAAPMSFIDGGIEISEAPGLGIPVDEAKVQRYRVGAG